MVKRYSEDELAEYAAFYEEHGVVRLPGLIEPEWVEKILATIDEVAKLADEPRKPGEDLSFGRADGRMTIRYMWREIPAIRDFMLRRDLAEPIARIIDSKTLRFWFDLTFIHQKSQEGKTGPGTAWHHDCSSFDFKGMKLASLWMAMTTCDAERSRLLFIDKSHKTVPGFYRAPSAVYHSAATKGKGEREKDGFLDCPDYDQLVASGQEKILTWDCEPGDAIILHPYTVHGAKGNVGSAAHGRRVAITTRWLGDDVRYLPTPYINNNPAPGLAAADFPLGALPKGDYFPLVWDQ